MNRKTGSLPRKVWLYWDQGFDQAPELIGRIFDAWGKKCLEEGWSLHRLDRNSIGSYIEIPLATEKMERLPKALQADLIRLLLLEKYGGVWSDATVLCRHPLERWLPQLVEPSGFFAFDRPAETRPMANWFMAATPENYLVKRLREEFVRFFELHDFPVPGPWRTWVGKRLKKWTERHGETATQVWFHPWITEGLKIYPYFLFHYLFALLLRTDERFRYLWEQTPRISAERMLGLKRYGLDRMADMEILEGLVDERLPLVKLDWKQARKSGEGSMLEALFQRSQMEDMKGNEG